MSARVLTFEPSEFVVLEDSLEIDETVQRPEAVRFFTREEQETDAFEALMPKGRTTQAQLLRTRDLVSRMRELYDTYVLALPDDYTLREPERGTNLSWVQPVYADVELRATTFVDAAGASPTAAGYYPRLIASLPRPYQTTGGTQQEISVATEFVNSTGTQALRVLPAYTATRMLVHEDKTTETVPRRMEGSEDVVNQLGYWLQKRPLPIPNPLADHPFLSSPDASFVESPAPLKDVLPSLDAVLTHGVPVTTDPYGEASPFLKLYDIQLSSIPWSSWKSRFPPVEVEQVLRESVEIPFPKAEELAPSSKILEAYKTTYAPGLSVREWLMRQDDGGEFVAKALLSKTIDNGSVELLPGVDLPLPTPPPTTLDECSLLGLTFPDFLVKGLLRMDAKGKLLCAPLEFVRQEIARAGYVNRLPWKDSTENEIKVKHLTALRAYRRQEPDIPILAEEKTPGRPESAHRREAVAILQDPERHSRDKLRDLETIVSDDVLDKNVYRDADGQFVLCEHTLAILSGDLERDRTFFYDVWTAKVEGWRVCKYCGERLLGDDLVDQEEYDEQGFVLNKKEALETGPIFHGESIAAFVTGLKAMTGLFKQEDPCDAMVFLLISLLQVLPEATQVKTWLDQGRLQTAGLGTTDAMMKGKGLIGIAITALLLQTHVPLLEPRRSFWSKPLTFDGYPRDGGSASDFGIVDILFMVLENTYRGFPKAIAGSTKQGIRAVLTDATATRTAVFNVMDKRLLTRPEVKDALQRARAVAESRPVVPQPRPFLPIRPPTATSKEVPKCPSGYSCLAGKNPPRIRQPTLVLRRGIHASSNRESVRATTSERVEVAVVPTDEIRTRLTIKGVPAKEGYRTNLLLASRLASMAKRPTAIATVDPTESRDRLRDIAKGFLYEAAQLYKGAQTPATATPVEKLVATAAETDVTLFCLLADYDKSKAAARSVRATERLKYVKRMAEKTDYDREITMELAKRGLAPVIITLEERKELGASVDLSHLMDVGVGVPQLGDAEEQATEVYANAGADDGDYGNLAPLPFREGRDPYEANILEDPERSI